MKGRAKGGPEREEPSLDEDRLLIEFHRIGNVVKVTAVDPVSLIEVSIVGDPAMGEAGLSRAAVRKLRYVMQKRRGASPEPPGGRSGGGRGGTLV
jgi:hypothetical protein